MRKGWYFAAARIRPGGSGNQKIQESLKAGTIAALHLAYKATELSYPLRVTIGNPGASRMEIFVMGTGIQRPPLLQALRFQLEPTSQSAFHVQGPPGLVSMQGTYPTLRGLLPQGGTLFKFTGVLSAQQRNQDMVFRRMSTAMR